MARKRDPRRDEAFRLWINSDGQKKLNEIADELGVSPGTVRGWKNKDHWVEKLNGTFQKENTERSNGKKNAPKKKRGAPKGSQNAKGHGAPKGNKNAVGNKGGSAPARNSNAVKTGVYRNFFDDVLNEDELSMIDEIEINPVAQIAQDIKMYWLREKAILKNMKKIEDGLVAKTQVVIDRRRKIKEPIQVEDPLTGGYKTLHRDEYRLVTEEVMRTEESQLDTLLKLEDSLSRVRKEKLKAYKLFFDMTEKFEHDKEMNEIKVKIAQEKWDKEKGEADKQKEGSEDWVNGLLNVMKKRKGAAQEEPLES